MSEQQPNVTPQQIFEHLWAARAALALAAGVELGVFSHVEAGKNTVKDVARAAKASARGMRHLMDALTGMGYLNKKGDKYTNTPVASQFLVKDKPTYMGIMVAETRMTFPGWVQLPEVVQTGRPVKAVDTEEAGKDFFPKLVQAIFPMSYGGAQAAI